MMSIEISCIDPISLGGIRHEPGAEVSVTETEYLRLRASGAVETLDECNARKAGAARIAEINAEAEAKAAAATIKVEAEMRAQADKSRSEAEAKDAAATKRRR